MGASLTALGEDIRPRDEAASSCLEAAFSSSQLVLALRDTMEPIFEDPPREVTDPPRLELMVGVGGAGGGASDVGE